MGTTNFLVWRYMSTNGRLKTGYFYPTVTKKLDLFDLCLIIMSSSLPEKRYTVIIRKARY